MCSPIWSCGLTSHTTVPDGDGGGHRTVRGGYDTQQSPQNEHARVHDHFVPYPFKLTILGHNRISHQHIIQRDSHVCEFQITVILGVEAIFKAYIPKLQSYSNIFLKYKIWFIYFKFLPGKVVWFSRDLNWTMNAWIPYSFSSIINLAITIAKLHVFPAELSLKVVNNQDTNLANKFQTCSRPKFDWTHSRAVDYKFFRSFIISGSCF